MSMTKEEAIKQIEKLKSYCEYMADSDESGAYLFDLDGQALDLALSALRPITRKRVEKMFSGCPACNDRRCTSCWCFGRYEEVCRKCENQSGYQPLKFCPHCGKPLRDAAVDMVMERLEALYDKDM